MKYLIIFFIPVLIFAQENFMTQHLATISEVKSIYAPDKRVNIFNIEPLMEGDTLILRGETNILKAKEEVLLRMKDYSNNIKDEIKILPAEDLNGMTKGIINVSVANIRSKEGHSEEMGTQSLLGTIVNVFKKNRGWFLIQTPDNYIGWVDDEAVESVLPDKADEWKAGRRIIYTKIYGFSFSEANENSQTVSDLVIGNILKTDESYVSNDFYKVFYPDGRLAFVKKSESMEFDEWVDSREPNQENILKTAKIFMGIPYLWGGTSSKGLDCSGFTKTVYYLNGIVLQRDASQQVHTGEFVAEGVDIEKYQPGDLLFFGTKASENNKERITHVGIYIGNGEYIHEAGRVKINSLDNTKENFSKHRYDTLIRTKRILTSISKNGIEKIKENKQYY